MKFIARLAVAVWLLGQSSAWSVPPTMGEQPDGSVLVPTNQLITPAGSTRRIEGERPKDLAVSPDGKLIAALAQTRVILFAEDGTLVANVGLKAGPLGIAWMPDSRSLFVSGDNGQVYRIMGRGDSWNITGWLIVADKIEKSPHPRKTAASFDEEVEWRPVSPEANHLQTVEKPSRHHGNPQVAGLAVSSDGKRLYLALGMRNAVVVVNIETDSVIATVPVGIAPYRIELAPNNRILFVADRGGPHVKSGEPSALTGGTAVRIDPATDAAVSGSLSFVNTNTFAVTELEEGRQPSGMCVIADGSTLYVANSDDDTVAAIDTVNRRVQKILSLRPLHDAGFGQMPTDVGLSDDGKFLYVTCGGGNAIAVVSLPGFSLAGYIPTAWFPIALVAHGENLFVACSKGIGARQRVRKGAFRVRGSVGIVEVITPTERRDLSALTRHVALNNHWDSPELPARNEARPMPVPERVGEPSVFKHVVYIIKENHSYDVDLGDLREGNSDKSLCVFGEDVTPNEHAIARQFVLLDNTYTSGSVSADGHAWTDSAVANAYLEQNYDSYARSFPFNGADPLAYSPAGFLWTAAAHAGRSVRVYGEFVSRPHIVDPVDGKKPSWSQLWQDYRHGTHKYQITADTDNAALKPYLHPNYIGFPLIVSDQWRADQFLSDLKTFEATGAFPSLSILLLPSNHTAGTTPGMPTPRALVADNDLALGRIVEALSHSRFWPDTLILVIEDDSNFGLDHVDGHRAVAFCISPYTRRGAIVSEPYNHTSFVRTIGLVLGLPAMNRFDRTATPLTACFTEQPDLHPYTHAANRKPLDEMNPPIAALHGERRYLAEASRHLDWSREDRADSTTIARASWIAQRPHEPFPWRHFNPGRESD